MQIDYRRPRKKGVTERKTGSCEQNQTQGFSMQPQRYRQTPTTTRKNYRAWLSVRGTTVSGRVLSATEFWDFLCACYNVYPLNLQSHCDRCGTASGMTHALICSKGRLFITRHNKICDKLLYLSLHAFTSSSVRAAPLIHQGYTRL